MGVRYPHPKRKVIDLFEVDNTYDSNGRAVQATLSCGHKFILTGKAIKFIFIPCRRCRVKSDQTKATQRWKRPSIH